VKIAPTIAFAIALGISLAGAERVAFASDRNDPAPPGADPLVPFPPPTPKVIAPVDRQYVYSDVPIHPTFPWLGLQLLPSPEVAFGNVRPAGKTDAEIETAFGLRWQLTPVLWSWGVNRRVTRWRFFVVDPLARHSGSIEIPLNLEYIWGHVDRMVVRPGVRAYFPLAHRGEYLSMSLGTSTYAYDEQMRVAYDAGLYILYGTLGIQATVAPNHGPLSAIGTIRIKYF